MKKLSILKNKFSKKISKQKTHINKIVKKHPLRFFYGVLLALVVCIVLGNILRTPKKAEINDVPVVKKVAVYSIGAAPKITVTGQVEKTGVIHIVAQTSGIIQKINTREGSKVKKGAVLINISSNYQGGNSFSLQRQLAATQYQNVVDTYDTQKNIINKQREVADQSDLNSDKLRDITNQSISETRSLVSLNDNIISTLDSNLATLEQNSSANADLILATKQIKSQFISANNQAKSSLRQSEYTVNSDNSPSKLSDLQKDITKAQLDIQEKMLDLNKEVSRIQVQIARVTEGLMTPSAPFSGVIERIFVKEGQSVNPGTPLAIIVQRVEDDPATVIAYVTHEIAQQVSQIEPSILHISQTKINVIPSYISTEAVNGNLHAVYYSVPDEYVSRVTDNSTVQVDIPLGYSQTSALIPYIPLDSVHQTTDASYVFVERNNKAVSKKVVLGDVYGSLVQVDGLSENETIILDRTVIDGSRIQILR